MFIVNKSLIPKFFTYHENLLTKTERSWQKQLILRGYFSQRENSFPKNGWEIVQSIKQPSKSQMLTRFAYY